MQDRKKIIATIILLVSAIPFVAAIFQPRSGKHSWFLELSGDWTLWASSNDYEIHPLANTDAERVGSYRLCRIVPYKNGEIIHRVVDSFDLYNSNEAWIVVKTNPLSYVRAKSNIEMSSGMSIEFVVGRDDYPFTDPVWAWVDTLNHKLYYTIDEKDFTAQAPQVVQQLAANMHSPKKSHRWDLCELGGILFIVAIIMMLKKSKKKNVMEKAWPQKLTQP